MLKTMTALSLGFLLAGAAAANAGETSRSYERHAHRAVRHETIDSRASALAPAAAPATQPETGLLGLRIVMPERRPRSDLPSAEWNYRGGDAGYTWEPYGWQRMMG
jgi:hypothetical protein